MAESPDALYSKEISQSVLTLEHSTDVFVEQDFGARH